MARRIPTRLNLLTVRQVQTAGDGDHNDGGGLVLRVRGGSVAWVFRFTSPIGERREMGLGIASATIRLSPEGASQTLANWVRTHARCCRSPSIPSTPATPERPLYEPRPRKRSLKRAGSN